MAKKEKKVCGGDVQGQGVASGCDEALERADSLRASDPVPVESGEGSVPGEHSQELETGASEETLRERVNVLQEQYLRKAADLENYRKRALRERQEAVEHAYAALLADIVAVLDDFDRAIEAADHASSTEVEASSAFREGVLMIRKQLSSVIETKYGLEYYPVLGERFDPNLHEALSMSPSASVHEKIVGAELQKGYRVRNRILRHAKVMVLTPEEQTEPDRGDGPSE